MSKEEADNQVKDSKYKSEIIQKKQHPVYGSHILIKFPESVVVSRGEVVAFIYLRKDGKELVNHTVYMKSDGNEPFRIKIRDEDEYSVNLSFTHFNRQKDIPKTKVHTQSASFVFDEINKGILDEPGASKKGMRR